MSDSHLADTLKAALLIRDRMKSEGRSRIEIDHYLEGVLRTTWPQGRVWKYLCDECDDTGLIMLRCEPGRQCAGISTRTDGAKEKPGKYRRLCALHPESDYTHDYGIPCQCRAGQRFKPQERTPETEVEAAARVGKPTRFGR